VGVYNRLELALFCVNSSFAGEENPEETNSGEADPANTKLSDAVRVLGSGRDARERGGKPQPVPNSVPPGVTRAPGKRPS